MTCLRLGAGVLLAGLLGLLPGCSSGPAGPLLGVWELTPDEGKRPDDRPRSTESIVFKSNGEWLYVRQRVGQTLTTKGTWELLRADGNVLYVKFHKPETPPGKDEPPPRVTGLMSEWKIEVIDADRLVATTSAGEEKSRRFDLRRLTE